MAQNRCNPLKLYCFMTETFSKRLEKKMYPLCKRHQINAVVAFYCYYISFQDMHFLLVSCISNKSLSY